MIWNQMCASCHNTRVRKNYDPPTDTYKTSMADLTVSCESCHGPMKAHALNPTIKTNWTRDQHTENCAGCHARRGEITGDFVPGESFWDHYLLAITDGGDIYYPDGQIRDENYEFSSFLSSRMYHSGVRCMDCHDMHSMKTILPGNQLCMRCHTAGGGLLDWRLGYQFSGTFFESGNFTQLSNLQNQIETRGRWRFLPRLFRPGNYLSDLGRISPRQSLHGVKIPK